MKLEQHFLHPDLEAQMERMKLTPQDPIHHAEGDVWTHTAMVYDAMLRNTEGMDPRQRELLLRAAAWHDIAKPECTETDIEGRVSSPSHARRGAQYAIRYLKEEGSLSTEELSTLYHLIRFHGRPLWLLERNLQREIMMLSQKMPLPMLYQLVLADIEGRECGDKDDLLLKLEIFREESTNPQLGNPWENGNVFPTAHTRYHYFYGNQESPVFERWDDTEFDFYIMCGLPGSGKDTWIEKNLDLPVISIDKIRQDNKWTARKDWARAQQAGKMKAQEYCRKKQPFVWNATCLRMQVREELISGFSKYGGRGHIVWLDKPLKTTLQQNKSRENIIREDAILDMLWGFEIPSEMEAYSLRVVN